MSSKIRLPVAQDQVSSPSVGWGFKEDLGRYTNPDRWGNTGAGSRSDGVLSIAASETWSFYPGFLPGHLYQLTFVHTGSTDLTISMAGTQVTTSVVNGANTLVSRAVFAVATRVNFMQVTIAETGAATATISELFLTCLDKISFDLAYIS